VPSSERFNRLYTWVQVELKLVAARVSLMTGNALKCARWDLRPWIRPGCTQLAGERAGCRGL